LRKGKSVIPAKGAKNTGSDSCVDPKSMLIGVFIPAHGPMTMDNRTK
jgi:hypothetical protein